MNTVKAFEHITITSGACRLSSRSEVDPRTLGRVAGAIERGSNVPIAGWRIAVNARLGGYDFMLSAEGVAIVKCWLCLSAQDSERIFEEASETALDGRVIIPRPKGVPWLAVSLTGDCLNAMAAGTLRAERLFEAGDLERCVAWTLMDQSARE